MAINFKFKTSTEESAKKRAEQTNMRDSYVQSGYKFFKPVSKTRNDWSIQVFPGTWDENGEIWDYSIFVHFQIGVDKTTFLCPKRMRNERCPICEEVARLLKTGAPKKVIDEIVAKEQRMFWVRDLDDTKETTPILWTRSPYAISQIMQVCKEETRRGGQLIKKYVPLDDINAGNYLSFHLEGEGVNGTKYTAWKVNKGDPFDEEDLQFVVDNPIPSVLKFYEYDYIRSKFDVDEAEPTTTESSSRITSITDEDVEGELPFDPETPEPETTSVHAVEEDHVSVGTSASEVRNRRLNAVSSRRQGNN